MRIDRRTTRGVEPGVCPPSKRNCSVGGSSEPCRRCGGVAKWWPGVSTAAAAIEPKIVIDMYDDMLYI